MQNSIPPTPLSGSSPQSRTAFDEKPTDKVEQNGRSEAFNVVYVSAGNAMFGCSEGPWNISARLEQKLGTRLRVVAIINPTAKRALDALQKKRSDPLVANAYKDTLVFGSFDDLLDKRAELPESVQVFAIGSPPFFRGSTRPGADLELRILKHFPEAGMFIEKPVATGPREDIKEVFAVSKAVQQSGVTCSVGYMLRYLKAVQMIKKMIEEKNLTVKATIANYVTAYHAIEKPDWWDKSKSYGPIIEQGTHLCDLSRYFGGEAILKTVMANSLEWHESAGHLSAVPIDESKIKPEDRMPRGTCAIWKNENGSIGSLTHVFALHGTDFICEFQVICDGYRFQLQNPYTLPVLRIRHPDNDSDEVHRFPDDDPFFAEVSKLVDEIEGSKSEDGEDGEDGEDRILSSFEDACKTYELTWAIRHASERQQAALLNGSATSATVATNGKEEVASDSD